MNTNFDNCQKIYLRQLRLLDNNASMLAYNTGLTETESCDHYNNFMIERFQSSMGVSPHISENMSSGYMKLIEPHHRERLTSSLSWGNYFNYHLDKKYPTFGEHLVKK